MRIGIFTDTYRPQVNGVVSSIMTLEKELRKLGHKVYIITTTDPDAPKVEPNVLRLPSMEFKPLPQYRLGMVYSSRIIKKIKKLRIGHYSFSNRMGSRDIFEICGNQFGNTACSYLSYVIRVLYALYFWFEICFGW